MSSIDTVRRALETAKERIPAVTEDMDDIEAGIAALATIDPEAIRREAFCSAFIRLCKRLGINSETGYIIDGCKRIEVAELEAAIRGAELDREAKDE